MRLIALGIVVATLASGPAAAQGSSQPQISPTPPPPVYAPAPGPPPAPRSTKERRAKPSGDPGTWVTNDDYPPEAVRNDWQGLTGFRLTVGPDGMVTACDITVSSGFSVLDATACRVMTKRARFYPALDKKGKPTVGTWASRFRWVLPKPAIEPGPQPFVDTMSFMVEPDGSASNCAKSGGGSRLASQEGPCGKGQVFEPYRDASGNPVRRQVTLTLSVVVVDPDAPPPVITAPAPPATKPKRRKP